MPVRMISRACLIAFASVATSQSLAACCLTDWLYGRTPTYAVAPAAPVTVGYAPPTVTPYSASYAPLTGTANNTSVLPLAGSSIYTPGAPYSVQRPAYGAVPLDNPSVYTGLPVANSYRGLATTPGSFYGVGNAYPNNYASASPSVAPITALRPDLNSSTTTLPITTEPRFATPIRSGLARFFSSLLGTGYRSSYYTAPITYYRPATTVDPLSGTTVTVQQPCTSTVQQLQRTPMSTLTPLAGQPGLSPLGSSCQNGGCASDYQPLGPPTLAPSTTYQGIDPSPPGSIGQSNYLESMLLESGYGSSTYDSPAGSNLAPLTGADRYVPSPSDQEPMQAPSLRSARPVYPDANDTASADQRSNDADETYEAYRDGYQAGRAAAERELEKLRRQQNQPSTSYDLRYQSQSPAEDTPSGQESNSQPSGEDAGDQTPNSSSGMDSLDQYLGRYRYQIQSDANDARRLTTRVQPIPAPRDYRNPFTQSRSESQANETKQSEAALRAPDLLPALPQPSHPTAIPQSTSPWRSEQPISSLRLSVPVREASLEDRSPVQPTRTRRQVSSSSQNSGWYSLEN